MNILITGAFGFVGTNLSKSLNRAFNPYLIAIDIYRPDKDTYDEYFHWNSLNKIHWDKLDVIIHLAGKAHDLKNTTHEKAYFDVNLGLTKQIFSWYMKSGASKFIYFSSVKAIADKINGEILTEDFIPDPLTAYGKSKLAAEQFILNQLLPENKKIYILRPCMIHGPSNKGNLNLLYHIVKKGIPWPLGKFHNGRSFLSIDNLIFVLNQILEKNIDSGVYHIADDECISTNRLIQLIAESGNRKPIIWNINKNLIRGIARFGDLVYLPLNSERLNKLTESYIVSNKKIKDALKIQSMPIGAEEGMKKTLNSF
jgi:nucleoside-diphosphate-sugar epimerase